eukprot:767617-Hanusia_phi.AAC.3
MYRWGASCQPQVLPPISEADFFFPCTCRKAKAVSPDMLHPVRDKQNRNRVVSLRFRPVQY